MKNLKLYRLVFLPAVLFFVSGYSQNKMLTKISGGSSWDLLAFSSGAVELSLASGAYIYMTDNQDYTFIDRNNGFSKSILLHNGTPGQDNPPHGMIINIVNRSSRALPFNGGGAGGYESISGSFTNASIAANSSLALQWNSATSRWYEIL